MPHLSRRDALRTLSAAAGVLPFFARLSEAEVVGVGRAAHSQLAGAPGYRLQTLTPRQGATTAAMAETIIPETDTPGATAVRVHEFIDLIVTDWFATDEAEAFLRGLARVDASSRTGYQKGFAEASAEEKASIVGELDADLARIVAQKDGSHTEEFFYQFKRLTLTGYYTSEAGMTEELQWQAIPGAYRPCEPLEDLSRG